MNTGAGTLQPDASGGYQAAVKQTVQDANAAGLYVILDLHWTAPGNYLGDTQDQLPDTDHSVQFWNSLAQAFGNNPAVIFDLFNEPYPTAVDGQNAYEVELNGATQTDISFNSGKSTIRYTWTSVGMQELVNTVRNAGATNLLMIGGASGATDLSGFTTAGGGYFPSDPLRNIAASWHAYGVDSQSFTKANASYMGTINPTEVANQILAQGIPIIIGEVGDRSSNGTSGAPKISYITSWADAHGASVLPWTWDVWSATGGTENLLIKDLKGTPTDGEGVTYKDWLAQH
jgi:aryl-phospho-beta-D-glucosidase BglC (GH1 family)